MFFWQFFAVWRVAAAGEIHATAHANRAGRWRIAPDVAAAFLVFLGGGWLADELQTNVGQSATESCEDRIANVCSALDIVGDLFDAL